MKRLKIYFLITITLIINSCGVNEEIGNQSSPKSSTYSEKVTLNELLEKLKNRDSELALFIENNPVSNLKTNSGSTDYYFDDKNIVAIKNDKNEAAYSIPLYITSEKRSNILNNLSVEITDTNVDIKLVTIEGMDDGTIRYYASPFHAHQPNYTPSKTARIDCYCVTVYSDCTCCATHADGGCTHPNVFTSCGCSGDGYSDPTPSPTTSATKSSWTGGSGGGTSYLKTGEGIFLALQKMFKPDYEFSALEKHTIVNNYNYSKALIDFLNNQGFTPANKAFTLQMLYRIEDQQFTLVKQLNNAIQNFIYSQKSPLDVNLSAIFNNINLPENKKFNEIYKNLTDSPEFKKLFLDIFDDNKKFNVTFEVNDHVYENNDPSKKEVHATTSEDPITKAITIKISKQILIAGTTMSQTNIENAKTILHECIHAYLFVKAKNPTIGAEFIKILNTMYPTANEQHDFMYAKMIPTMQKVLSEIRDSVTTQTGRTKVQERTMHPTILPLTSTPWNWDEYYKYLSLSGLDEATCFKVDFAVGSDHWNLLGNYIKYGHDDLQN
ncbi:SprT-like domain-containing protein [Flavobacterium sp. SH_e]|uniref:SprT-like domain-containing protein n=1 Tax=Flavobacterium sp. SH_e TaxID=2983767 RepID=UPI0021E44501|nr:SprT-like domain-containing protein [Flavobacterium sp. SH_e]MCV2484072.1 SprT-like domain-containing protein [Flavobacterium sp. SH_e]